MGLSKVFQKAAVTAFKIADDISKTGVYIDITDDGFTAPTEVEYPLDIIKEKFSEIDRSRLSFGDRIQRKDLKGMVPSLSLTSSIKANNKIRTSDDVIYTIVDLEIDAANALYILLLRKV